MNNLESIAWQLVLSSITIWMTLLAGDKHKRAWIIGLIAQDLWLAYILKTQQWGLLPMNACLWVVYARNHYKWNKKPIDLGLSEDPAPEIRV